MWHRVPRPTSPCTLCFRDCSCSSSLKLAYRGQPPSSAACSDSVRGCRPPPAWPIPRSYLQRRPPHAVFSYTGRAVFLVFVGCICFGMIDSSLQQYSAYTCVRREAACLFVQARPGPCNPRTRAPGGAT